jgi:carboxylesterase type B
MCLQASIFGYTALLPRKTGIGPAFRESLKKSFSARPPSAEAILLSYELKDSDDDDTALLKILRFGSDICFFAPAVQMATAFPGRSYLYHFNEPNPWDGAFKGHATHVLDIAFLMQNYREFLSDEQGAGAVQFAKDVIAFANGERPWQEFRNASDGAAIYASGKRTFVEASKSPQTGRSQMIFELSKGAGGLDTLLDAWETFLFNKEP